SFDPITNGHLDLIARSSRMAGRLIVAVLRNQAKHPLFSVGERLEMIAEVVKPYPNVEEAGVGGRLVDFPAARGASMIVRGMRAVSDYELEWEMALMNRRLKPEIETVFLMAGEEYSFISSHLVKEVAALGGNVSDVVPPSVEQRLKKRIAARKA